MPRNLAYEKLAAQTQRTPVEERVLALANDGLDFGIAVLQAELEAKLNKTPRDLEQLRLIGTGVSYYTALTQAKKHIEAVRNGSVGTARVLSAAVKTTHYDPSFLPNVMPFSDSPAPPPAPVNSTPKPFGMK